MEAKPERQARVELEQAVSIPSTLKALAVGPEPFPSVAHDEESGSDEDSSSQGSEESVVVDQGDVQMLDDNHSVRTGNRFVVG